MFAGGEKGEGGEEGGEVYRHSAWPGQEIRVLWGQEDKFPSCIVIWPCKIMTSYPPETGRASSGTRDRKSLIWDAIEEVVWVWDRDWRLSRLLETLSS